MKTYKNFVALSLIALFAIAPTLSYAREREKGEEREREYRTEVKMNAQVERPSKTCLKAFGHLIAKGFIKNKGEVSADFWKDCFVPKGIAKKFGGHATGTASSTLDVTAPTIENVSAVSGASTAIIGWKTSENATSTLYYGTSSPLSLTASSTLSVRNSVLRKINLVTVSGLSASTTYYFRIQAADKTGNATTSAESSFTTR